MNTSSNEHNLGAGKEPVVLIIDDDPQNLAIMTDLLETIEVTVLVAEDGESGVKRGCYADPDLILLDIMMPGIDGYETCRRLKADPKTREIPVICMTALADTEHKLRGFEAGCVDYITQPFQRRYWPVSACTCALGDLSGNLGTPGTRWNSGSRSAPAN